MQGYDLRSVGWLLLLFQECVLSIYNHDFLQKVSCDICNDNDRSNFLKRITLTMPESQNIQIGRKSIVVHSSDKDQVHFQS